MDLSKTPFLHDNSDDSPRSSDTHVDDMEEVVFSTKNAHLRTSRSRESRFLPVMIRVVVTMFAMWGILSAIIQIVRRIKPEIDIYRPSTFPTDLNLCSCGTTIAQARAKGCKFDSMAAAWLPAHCRDDALTAEFESSGPGPNGEWPYYADANGTIPLSLAEIGLLGESQESFWARRDWHVAHCLWYWEKYVRMRDTGAIMERKFDRTKHVRHCRHMVLKTDVDPGMLIEVWVAMSGKIEDTGMPGMGKVRI